MTTPRRTLPSSPNSFWRKTKLLSSANHRTPLFGHPVTSSYFQKWNWNRKDAGSIPLRSRPNRIVRLTLTEKNFQEAFQKWSRWWDRCLHAGGNYFAGDGGPIGLWWVLWFSQRQSGKFLDQPSYNTAVAGKLQLPSRAKNLYSSSKWFKNRCY